MQHALSHASLGTINMATKRAPVSALASKISPEAEVAAIKAVNSYLRRLKTRLLKLRDVLRQKNLPEAEVEIKKCEAFAKNIGALAGYQGISPMQFFSLSQDVHELSIEISDRIERMKNVWWRRAWRWIETNALGILKHFAPLLGWGGSALKLLK